MIILPIYNCFNPILREKSIDVAGIDDKLVNFSKLMIATMLNADGIGLAANQVGDRRSLIIVDFSAGNEDNAPKPVIMINPKIENFSEEVSEYKEGCLSIPTFYDTIERPKEIDVTWTGIDGKENKLSASDLLSRVIQHEIDHLNGILFIDRMSQIKKTLSKSKLKKIESNKFEIHYDMIDPSGKFINSSFNE